MVTESLKGEVRSRPGFSARDEAAKTTLERILAAGFAAAR